MIFADTWAGKYSLLDDALALVRSGGWYVIDDMRPQPNWPEGHAHKAAQLIAPLAQRMDFHIAPVDWASGIIIAVRR